MFQCYWEIKLHFGYRNSSPVLIIVHTNFPLDVILCYMCYIEQDESECWHGGKEAAGWIRTWATHSMTLDMGCTS